MTLRQFLDAMDSNIELTVYHNHQPINFWYKNDPRLHWRVTHFEIISDFEMCVDITE